MQQVKCTYDDYDKYMELFQMMNFKAMDYVPEKKELLNIIFPDFPKYVLLLMWIDETGYETEENRECRALIRKVLTTNLILIETDSTNALEEKNG